MALRRGWLPAMTAAIIFSGAPEPPAAPVSRLDFFDKADNFLFFVTFDYDASGNNTGRSVFTGDSTFIRRTVFTNNSQGVRTRETSFDFNDDTAGYTAFPGPSVFSVFDRFGQDELGGRVTVASAGQNTYSVSQAGTGAVKIRYSYATDGSLSRIDVLDSAGAPAYRAVVSGGAGAVLGPGPGILVDKPSFGPVRGGRFQVRFSLQGASFVRLELFSLAGRRTVLLFQGGLLSGKQLVTADLAAGKARRPASGVYLVRLSIDGRSVLEEPLILETLLERGRR